MESEWSAKPCCISSILIASSIWNVGRVGRLRCPAKTLIVVIRFTGSNPVHSSIYNFVYNIYEKYVDNNKYGQAPELESWGRL